MHSMHPEGMEKCKILKDEVSGLTNYNFIKHSRTCVEWLKVSTSTNHATDSMGAVQWGSFTMN